LVEQTFVNPRASTPSAAASDGRESQSENVLQHLVVESMRLWHVGDREARRLAWALWGVTFGLIVPTVLFVYLSRSAARESTSAV
jgi:hypothetical protein